MNTMTLSLDTPISKYYQDTELLANLNNKKNKLKIRVGIPTNLENEKHPDEVPRIIHRIWIGGQVRESDLENMLQNMPKKPNGHFPQSWLWVDGTSISKTPTHYLRHIRVIQIADLFSYAKNVINSPALINQLHGAYLREANGCLHNYAAASDIVRYMIMHIFGGIYLDMDVRWKETQSCNVFSDVDQILEEQSADKAIIALQRGNGVIFAKPLATHFLTYVFQEIITAYEVTGEWDENKRELKPDAFDSWLEKRLYDDM